MSYERVTRCSYCITQWSKSVTSLRGVTVMRELRSWRCLFLYPCFGLTLTGLLEGIGHNLSPLASSPLDSFVLSLSLSRLHLVCRVQNPPIRIFPPPLSSLSLSLIFFSLSRDTFTISTGRWDRFLSVLVGELTDF